MKFDQIAGHKNLLTDLRKIVNDNRLGHATLFTGPAGYGGLPVAIALAQYVSCTARSETDSCGVCPSCIKYEKLEHPDLHFVFPVNTTKKVTKEPVSDDFIFEWRSLVLDNPYFDENMWYQHIGIDKKQGLISKNESHEIVRKLQLKTFESDYKVMVTWLPEKMNQTSANKLLKILEEPPPGTLFLLVSESPDQLLSTILSRCHRIQMPRIEKEEMVDALRKKIQGNYVLDDIAHLSQGDFRQALELAESTEQNNHHFDRFTRLMRIGYKADGPAMIEWADELSSMGREQQKEFLRYALREVRENFLITVAGEAQEELVFQDAKETGFSEKFSPFINERNIEQISIELNLAHQHIASNAYSRIVLLDLGLKISKLIRM
jgi:DNA polymerase-3 subunit delta'